MSWNLLEIHRKIMELWIWMKFDQQAPGYTYCQEKSIFIKGRSEFWVPLKKEIRIDFMTVWIQNFVLNSAFLFRLVTAPSYLLMTLIRISVTRGVTALHP
jgi:hypothetical protein